jgi:hypothetical protein
MTAAQALRRITDRLDAARIPWLLTGSFAAAAHGFLRTTRAGSSERQLRDVAGVVAVQGDALDRPYVEGWAKRLGVEDLWRKVLDGLPPL